MSKKKIRVTGVRRSEPDLSKLALALLLLVEEVGPETVAEIVSVETPNSEITEDGTAA